MTATRIATRWGWVLAVMVGLTNAGLAKISRKPVEPTPLTAAGQQLEAQYAGQLQALKAEIEKALPSLGEPQQAAALKAYQDVAAASFARLNTFRNNKAKNRTELLADADKALAQAKADAQAPVKAVMREIGPFLASDALDAKLVKCVILVQATPKGLAAFAQQGKEQEALVEKLLSDTALMRQMLVGGGAAGGQYGRAMQIYTGIQQASAKAKEGTLQRLAVAVALEHAVPIAQRNPEDATDAPDTVDPVKRYLSYEKAYLNGELDSAFKELTVWDYRMVVNGSEPDWTSAWGRQMLWNYRPHEITTSDYRWRYVKATKTEVRYGSQYNKEDLPSLQFYQNIIKDGGVCGRRAFFGRFMLRAFGIPTTARPQHGHATLVHWTPDGWVICLGATWGWGWTSFGQDVDFLAFTQARAHPQAFLEALRAEWIGDVLGEEPVFGFHDKASGFWNGVSLFRQQAIVDQAKAKALAAVGTDIGEANESKEKDVVEAVTVTPADRKIVVGADGAITIPAVACSSPTNSTSKIIFMKSVLGGLQLHYGRLSKPETFTYTFTAPAAGRYALTARVVTTSDKQQMQVLANGAKEPTVIALPFTVGMWGKTEPVEVALVKGRNVLQFAREEGPRMRGLTIKDFTLTPLK